MEVIIYPVRFQANKAAANRAAAIKRNPRIVLGLATGETLLGLYANLVDMNKKGDLSFSKVTSFNLDEYVGIPAATKIRTRTICAKISSIK